MKAIALTDAGSDIDHDIRLLSRSFRLGPLLAVSRLAKATVHPDIDALRTANQALENCASSYGFTHIPPRCHVIDELLTLQSTNEAVDWSFALAAYLRSTLDRDGASLKSKLDARSIEEACVSEHSDQ